MLATPQAGAGGTAAATCTIYGASGGDLVPQVQPGEPQHDHRIIMDDLVSQDWSLNILPRMVLQCADPV